MFPILLLWPLELSVGSWVPLTCPIQVLHFRLLPSFLELESVLGSACVFPAPSRASDVHMGLGLHCLEMEPEPRIWARVCLLLPGPLSRQSQEECVHAAPCQPAYLRIFL